MIEVAVVGLGEAGRLFAADLVASGAHVRAVDPASVTTPAGVDRFSDVAGASAGAHLVLLLTTSTAADKVFAEIGVAATAGAIVADLSTSAPADKVRRADSAADQELLFVDVALMTPVPGRGLGTPSLASGSGAEGYAAMMRSLGARVEVVGERAGEASTRKLLRSVMMKGLAAVVIEALLAAERAGLASWLWSDLVREMEAANGNLLGRLVSGTGVHARRRVHEMEATAALLSSLGVEPLMTRATVASLQRAERDGVPAIPDQAKS